MDGLTQGTIEHFDELHERMRKVVAGLDEATLTRAPAEGENSIAVLVTHALGALQGWLHRAAGIDFARDRDGEFRARSSAGELGRAIGASETGVRDLVQKAAARGYDKVAATVDGRDLTVGYHVTHALTHASEHVAHAELTRNLLGRTG